MPKLLSTRSRLFGLALLAAALAGCAGSTGGARPQGAAAANAATSADSLAQTSWELVRWTQAGGALRDIPHGDNGEPVRLTFLAQGKQYRVNGFSRCNRYMGTYKLDSGKLTDLNRQCQLSESILRTLFLKVDPRIADALVSHAKSGVVPKPAAPPARAAEVPDEETEEVAGE